jgi:hypothetical protein
MTTIRLSFAILLLVGTVVANGRYEAVNSTDLLNRFDEYRGRLVAVTGEVCAINADGKSLRLFDKQRRTLIDVQLTQLKKSQRNALMMSSERNVSVYGLVVARDGKTVIEAHQVLLVNSH